jgi:hypothetical protein
LNIRRTDFSLAYNGIPNSCLNGMCCIGAYFKPSCEQPPVVHRFTAHRLYLEKNHDTVRRQP